MQTEDEQKDPRGWTDEDYLGIIEPPSPSIPREIRLLNLTVGQMSTLVAGHQRRIAGLETWQSQQDAITRTLLGQHKDFVSAIDSLHDAVAGLRDVVTEMKAEARERETESTRLYKAMLDLTTDLKEHRRVEPVLTKAVAVFSMISIGAISVLMAAAFSYPGLARVLAELWGVVASALEESQQ
jgi:hypothetical protein